MAPLCQRHECGQRVQGNGCFEDIMGCHGESESCAFLHCHGAGAAHPHLSLLWVSPNLELWAAMCSWEHLGVVDLGTSVCLTVLGIPPVVVGGQQHLGGH